MPLKRRACALAILALAACHEPPVEPATAPFTPHDGTRLRAVWSTALDGRPTLGGWFDTQLNSPCRFTPDRMGGQRCLPPGLPRVTSTQFADRACTQPIAMDLPARCRTGPVEDFIIETEADRVHLYRKGEPVIGQTYYWREGPSCNEGTLGAGVQAFRLGDEVPLDSLVKSVHRARPPAHPSDAIQPAELGGDDGSAESLGWQTIDTMGACSVEDLTDGRPHCLASPLGFYEWGTYADPDCKVEVMAFFMSEPGPRLFMLDWRNCGPAPLVRATGARVDKIYVRKDGACAAKAWPFAPDVELYAVGPVLPPDRLPPLRYQLEGSGRARRRILVGPGGVSSEAGWFDTQLAAACDLHALDGHVRCLPRPAMGEGSIPFSDFADAACTLPLLGEGDTCPLSRYYWGSDQSACPPRKTLYTPRADRYTGGMFFDRSGTACTLANLSMPPADEHVLEPAKLDGFPDLGPVVAPDASAAD
jgi:hypothetical protein